jgi:hypothetical protein
MRKPVACAFDLRRLLLRWGRLARGRGGFGAGEDGTVGGGAREQDGEADGAEHEDDGRVGSQLGEEVSRAAGAEGCLRTLTAEGTGEVGGLALLEENDADDEERNDNVESDEKTDQHSAYNLLVRREARRKCVDWGGVGNLDPDALWRSRPTKT